MNSATNIMFSLFALWSFPQWSVNNRYRYVWESRWKKWRLFQTSNALDIQNKCYSTTRICGGRERNIELCLHILLLLLPLLLSLFFFHVEDNSFCQCHAANEWLLDDSTFTDSRSLVRPVLHAICSIAWFAQGLQFSSGILVQSRER